MGRNYAGILGVIAFLTVLGRGLVGGDTVATTMRVAVCSLAAMAVVGAIIGRLGAWLVEESIRWRIHQELATEQRPAERVRPAERELPS